MTIDRNKDVAAQHRADYAKQDAKTPYKLTVWTKNGPVIRKFADKQTAIAAFHDEEETRMLIDFSKGVRIIGYKFIR